MKFKKVLSFIASHKRYTLISILIVPLLAFLFSIGSTFVQANWGSWGDNSLIHACKDQRGRVTIVSSSDSCNQNESEITWLKDVEAGDGLTKTSSTSGVILSLSSAANDTGWTTASETWTYASANSFTISGSNKTAVYTKGTRIKATNNSITYYGTVASSSYGGGDTTVTLVANSDYSLANSAITSPNYSYEANPQGYPGWFNYSPTWGGVSANPSSVIARFHIVGNTVDLHIHCGGAGISNATTFTMTLPVNAAQTYWAALINVYDNSNSVTTPGIAITQSSSSTLSLQKDSANTPWTASNGKAANFHLNYEF